LVVEDSELISSAFRILLEDSGYRVTVVESGGDAIDAAASAAVDLMLLDLTLPDGSGLDALRAMKERGVSPRVTLAMTGDDAPATRERCIAAGCAEVLVKPVAIRELRRVISARLS
jgi:Response regulators consisting of a CheY-like receiver domain and a winged-helix DNA-binding domain